MGFRGGSWSFIALLLASCGVNYKARAPLTIPDPKPTAPEFAPQPWAKSLPSSQSARQLPQLRINAPLAGVQPGDRLFIGASLRSAGSPVTLDPPQTGWILARAFAQVLSGSLPVSTAAIMIPEENAFALEAEYVLAVKLVRQEGDQEVDVKKVLNLAPFDIDLRVPVAEVNVADGRDPSAPLGLAQLTDSQVFRVRCSYRRSGEVAEIADGRPGDVALARYVAFPISAETEVQDAPRNGLDYYAVDLVADLSALAGTQDRPEDFFAECRTRAGRVAQVLLASGVDVTPPQAALVAPTLRSPGLVTAGQSFSVQGACNGVSSITLTVSTKAGASLPISQVRWAAGEPETFTCGEIQSSFTKVLQVDASAPLLIGQILITLTATDRAGNVTRSNGVIDLREGVSGSPIGSGSF